MALLVRPHPVDDRRPACTKYHPVVNWGEERGSIPRDTLTWWYAACCLLSVACLPIACGLVVVGYSTEFRAVVVIGAAVRSTVSSNIRTR